MVELSVRALQCSKQFIFTPVSLVSSCFEVVPLDSTVGLDTGHLSCSRPIRMLARIGRYKSPSLF
jgi:hypothetical protein